MDFEFICRLSPGCQKLFKKNELYYLCDDSGDTPDQTDDGPLRINPYISCKMDNSFHVLVSVFCERTNSNSHIMIDWNSYLTLTKYTKQDLIDNFGNQIKVIFK